jgi:hypothetical protein
LFEVGAHRHDGHGDGTSYASFRLRTDLGKQFKRCLHTGMVEKAIDCRRVASEFTQPCSETAAEIVERETFDAEQMAPSVNQLANLVDSQTFATLSRKECWIWIVTAPEIKVQSLEGALGYVELARHK